MGSGFSKMQKQARQMQAQLQKMQEEMKSSSFKGESGAGLVTVILNGEKILKKILIKPECVDPNDVEGLEDLIMDAYSNAAKKVEEEGGNFGLPEGLSLPF